jgi:hypothetical protein
MPFGPALIVLLVVVLALGGYEFYRSRHHGPTQLAGQNQPSSGLSATADASPYVQPTVASPLVTDTPTPATSGVSDDTNAEYQALSQVEDLLNASAQSRGELHEALQSACSDSSGALSLVNQVDQERQNEVATAQSLDLSAVPGGSTLGSQLVAMLRDSEQADLAYSQYVQDVYYAGCHAGKSAYDRGNSLSNTAQTAKKRFFAGEWPSLASEFGLTPHDNTDV